MSKVTSFSSKEIKPFLGKKFSLGFLQERRKQKVGVIVLLINDGNVLLGKRKNAYGSGKFGLPGGRVEFGEKLEMALKRELLEETGIKPKVYEFIGSVREDQGGYVFVHFAYKCKSFRGEIRVLEPEKCERWEWYGLDKLPKNILKGHQAAIKMYKEGLKIMDLV